MYDHGAERLKYLPKQVRVLFVGESAPDPGAGEPRFFYHPVLRIDNLFRGLMLALYGAARDELLASPKTEWLRRFQDDGYYLDDLSHAPVNHLPPRERRQTLRMAVPDLVARIKEQKPEGVIVCHGPTLRHIQSQALADLPLLHTEPIPFPLGNVRQRFVDDVRLALGRLK